MAKDKWIQGAIKHPGKLHEGSAISRDFKRFT
jgi:hypothetical protein